MPEASVKKIKENHSIVAAASGFTSSSMPWWGASERSSKPSVGQLLKQTDIVIVLWEQENDRQSSGNMPLLCMFPCFCDGIFWWYSHFNSGSTTTTFTLDIIINLDIASIQVFFVLKMKRVLIFTIASIGFTMLFLWCFAGVVVCPKQAAALAAAPAQPTFDMTTRLDYGRMLPRQQLDAHCKAHLSASGLISIGVPTDREDARRPTPRHGWAEPLERVANFNAILAELQEEHKQLSEQLEEESSEHLQQIGSLKTCANRWESLHLLPINSVIRLAFETNEIHTHNSIVVRRNWSTF